MQTRFDESGNLLLRSPDGGMTVIPRSHPKYMGAARAVARVLLETRDASGHEHAADSGQFTSGGGGTTKSEPPVKPKHGERAVAAHTKYHELVAAAQKTRADAFHEVKKDADAAIAGAQKHAEDAWDKIGNVMHDKARESLEDAVQSVTHDDLSVTDRFALWKQIEKDAKAGINAVKVGDDNTEETVSSDKELLRGIIGHARAARAELKAYVKHRREMRAIKNNEVMDVHESLTLMADLDDGTELMEAFDESKIKRDESGKFAEQASNIPHGELHHVGGIPVRHESPGKFRIETDKGHVVGDNVHESVESSSIDFAAVGKHLAELLEGK